MTTITERMEYASTAAHDFADAAMVQLFALLNIHERIGDETAAKHHPVLLAALIEAAAKTYAVERQHEAAELIADAVNDVGMAIRESSLPQAMTEVADALFHLKSVGRDALDMAERTGKGATK